MVTALRNPRRVLGLALAAASLILMLDIDWGRDGAGCDARHGGDIVSSVTR